MKAFGLWSIVEPAAQAFNIRNVPQFFTRIEMSAMSLCNTPPRQITIT